ncbi:MAG TPA: glycosyltransferase [Abditibacteriaceae bacterium]|jgi:cellulose synthase (UDP-forming)
MATENPEMHPREAREVPLPPSGTPEGVREGIHEGAVVTPLTGRERVGTRTVFVESGAPVPGTSRPPMTPTRRRLLIFTWSASFFMLLYLVFMGMAFFAPGYSLIDRIASIFLMIGTLYIMVHSLGYANSMVKASWGYNEVRRRAFTPHAAPRVACLLATFNEPPEVVEETIAALANMEYDNKEIVILDDSTREENRVAMRELAARYGIAVRQRTNRKGYKAGAINEYLQEGQAKYVAIFDADAVPAHNFLRDLVPILEENPKLSFVQTPQHYANVDISNVALAAARQQNVFYEYICEGKSYSKAAFCCGTNFIARREALLDVGGMDDSTVTEDFATSINLHAKGWDSAYYNQVYAYSLGPETLAAYFTQQQRWAFGSVKTGWNLLKTFFGGPQRMKLGQWWEYFLSTNYYWVGLINFIFIVLPLLYIFFGIKPLRQDVFTYLMLFVPYLIFSMNMFYTGMEQRGYKLTDMLLGQQVNFLCFPVHLAGAFSGLFGLKRPFGVTPKGEKGRMSWLALWPQLLMLVLSAIAFLYGMYKAFITGTARNDSAMAINSLWALYHVFLLSGIFRLNKPVRTRDERYFDVPASQRTGPLPAGTATAGGVPITGVRGVTPPPRVERRPSATGHMALILAILTTLGLLAGVFTMGHWAMQSPIRSNVYLLDRTVGRDYQEHRVLTWTLNFLKVQHNGRIYPENQRNAPSSYNFATDYYGFVPQPETVPDEGTVENTKEAAETTTNVQRVGKGDVRDLLSVGKDRPLPGTPNAPGTLNAPGVLFLVDTNGEFVERDYRKDRYVRYRNPVRGIQPEDVKPITDFYNANGLVIAEWNSISNATQFTNNDEERLAQKGLDETRKGLKYLQEVELPKRQKDLALARRYNNKAGIADLEEQVSDTKERIQRHKQELAKLGQLVQGYAGNRPATNARRQVEKLLHVTYRGWYGRFVDHIEQEREYDYQMWKSVRDAEAEDLNKGPDYVPYGQRFVFYRDGADQVYNPDTKQVEDNPFSEPIVIKQEELADNDINRVAMIHKAGSGEAGSDPLLTDVADSVPYHYWFDVVQAAPNSRVLAWYKLRVKKVAADRLEAAGFPATALRPDEGNTEIVTITLPALVAHREGETLRSLYFAGDASDYSLVPRFAEIAPSTGGIAYFLGHRAGPFSMKYYWNYYQPVLNNVFKQENSIQFTG